MNETEQRVGKEMDAIETAAVKKEMEPGEMAVLEGEAELKSEAVLKEETGLKDESAVLKEGTDAREEPEAGRSSLPDLPSVDILIPVYRPGGQFKELLRRMLSQTYPVKRIIIMNTEQKYWNEAEITPLFESSRTGLSVFHVTKPEFDHGRTRHLGMMKSDADICICMTQDAVPHDCHLVERLVEALKSCGNAAAAYARQLPAAGCGVIERYTRAFNYPPDSRIKTKADLPELGIKTYFCSNVCAAYRRELYLELGGFIQKTIFNEDMIFAGRAVQAGYAVVYAADAQVIHSHNYTAMEQLHRNFDLAVSQADHPEIFSGLPSEGEGIRLVKKTAAHLAVIGCWYLIPKLAVQSGMKYLGYRLGKSYRRLPFWLVKKLTMNRAYWD